MKTFRVLAGMLFLVAALGAGLQDYLTELKTSMKEVEGYVQDNIAYGNFVFPSACAKVPLARRAAIVRAVGEFARAFTASKAFLAWYDEYRDQHKPAAPTLTPPVAESRAEQIAVLQKQIAETEKNAQSAPSDQRKLFDDVLNALRSSLKDVERADKSQDAGMDKMIGQMNAAAKKEYDEKLAAYDREYPKGDARPLIRRRLNELLSKTDNIDFGAQLVKKGNVMVFKNPAYEQKPGEWKLAFRAGREATEAGRSYVREWLKSL